MTNKEMRAQVVNTVNALDGYSDRAPSPADINLVEALCREMIAEGIKIASQALQDEFSKTVSECLKEADMLKDGAQLKEAHEQS